MAMTNGWIILPVYMHDDVVHVRWRDGVPEIYADLFDYVCNTGHVRVLRYHQWHVRLSALFDRDPVRGIGCSVSVPSTNHGYKLAKGSNVTMEHRNSRGEKASNELQADLHDLHRRLRRRIANKVSSRVTPA